MYVLEILSQHNKSWLWKVDDDIGFIPINHERDELEDFDDVTEPWTWKEIIDNYYQDGGSLHEWKVLTYEEAFVYMV